VIENQLKATWSSSTKETSTAIKHEQGTEIVHPERNLQQAGYLE